jgi:hypothetical protein
MEACFWQSLWCDSARAEKKVNLLSSFRLATSATVCAALVACASAVDPAPTVIRTPAPQGYEKTITNYFAFRIRGSQKNAEVGFGAPEPGACPLDGYVTSTRGWVVPTVRATRTGEATGKETIKITTKQYYFWFLGNNIAGITPRIELCPGVGTTLIEDGPPSAVAGGLVTTAFSAPSQPEAQRREAVDRPDPPKRARSRERANVSGGQKAGPAHEARKTGTSSGKVRRAAKKVGNARGPAKPELKW